MLAATASAQAHQIVQNGGFETDVSGWAVSQGSLQHTTAIVHTGSGSAQAIVHPQYGASDIVQCIDVSTIMETWTTPDGAKQLTLSGYATTNATTINRIRLEAHFYSDPNCSESLQWHHTPSLTSPTGGWTMASKIMTVPSGTKSIGIRLFTEGAGGETVYWDNIEAHPNSDTGLTNEVQEVEKLAPTILPICVAVAAFGLFGLLGLMGRGRR